MATLQAGTDPILTKILIGINVVAYLLAQPGSDLYVDGLLIGGGLFSDVGFIGIDAGEWWRTVTSGFLHANLVHIGFNMFLLWLLGSELEPALGRARFALLYATSLLAGSFGVMLLAPDQPTVGASGAVFGLMGAMVVAQRASGINPWQSGIGGLVAINLVFTFAIPQISVGGHLGGLIGGALVGAVLVELPRRVRLGSRSQSGLITSVLVVAIAVGFYVGSLMLAGRWADSFF